MSRVPEGTHIYDSAQELMVWQRATRRQSRDLVLRHRSGDNQTPLIHMPQPGAELFCPACSSEARPDDADTATCGSCGTLSPLDAMVAYSNFIHHALHYGIRVRASLLAGTDDTQMPPVSRPFPLLTARIGSLLVLGAVAGLRQSQVDEMLMAQKPLLTRWLNKEQEEGDRGATSHIPDGATALEIADGGLAMAFADLPDDFPAPGTTGSTLRQAFMAMSQYYKFRTSSVYIAYLADGILLHERARLGLGYDDVVPWEDLTALAHALEPDIRHPAGGVRARGSEETLVRALSRFVARKHQLVQSVYSRHRVTQQVIA